MFDAVARSAARNTGLDREAVWEPATRRELASWRLDAADHALLAILLFARGLAGRLLLCNTHVRTASRDAFIDVVDAFRAAHPGRQLYLVTFAWDAGMTDLDNPVVDVVAMQRVVDNFLRRQHLTGLLSVEFDGVLKEPGEAAWPVLFHIHGVVVCEPGHERGLQALRASFAKARAFPNRWGAKGAHIKLIIDSPFDAARVAAYLADPIHQLKRRVAKPRVPGRVKLVGTRRGYSPAIILRLTEIQSHLSVYDAVFGVGTVGRGLRADWRRYMGQFARAKRGRRRELGPEVDVVALWARARQLNGSSRYQPCRITTRSGAYRAVDRRGAIFKPT